MSELLTSNRDRSVVTFAQFIIPKLSVRLQGSEGSGTPLIIMALTTDLVVDIFDLSPQFRSVHLNNANVVGTAKPPISSLSAIASLRRANFALYHNANSTSELRDATEYVKGPLATLEFHGLDFKMRHAEKTFASISLANIEGSLQGQNIGIIYAIINQWRNRVEDFLSEVQKTSQQQLIKARNLVAAIVLAGEEHGITNDPPFLTRPSHVLRISKNMLRINDSWKISSRVRHIARSLSPTVVRSIENALATSNSQTLRNMEPVLQILFGWRSWELSNIQDSYFFKWLSGASDESKGPSNLTIEGIMALTSAAINLDVGDGSRNMATITNAILSSNERLQHMINSRYVNVMGVDVSCASFMLKAESDILDILQVIQGGLSTESRLDDTSKQNPAAVSSLPVLEYRGTVLVNKTEFAAQIAGLDLALLTENLRISGFSQLYDDEKNSPSFCLSFERSDVTIRKKELPRQLLAEINLEQFSSQMISTHQKPGIAATLGLLKVRLSHPISKLLEVGIDTTNTIKKRLSMIPATPESEISHRSKADIPTVTFRLHRMIMEAWLVPDALAICLDSGGIQVVLGELTNTHQWGFFDIPPALFTFRRSTSEDIKLAEISTPFVAVKSRLTWTNDVSILDSDIQIGQTLLSMQSLATLFQLLTAKEVQEQITECGRVFDSSVSVDQNLTSARSINRSKRLHPLLFYRVHTLWESVVIRADTPDGAIAAIFSDIRLSLSNQHHGSNNANQIQFMAGSRSTTLSLLSGTPEMRDNVVDIAWEIGNSLTTTSDGKTLYRLYLVSDSLLFTLSPRSISQLCRTVRHVTQELRELRIQEIITGFDVGSKASLSAANKTEKDQEEDPFSALYSLDAVRVSFSQVKFKWMVEDQNDVSTGFTFTCKTVDASVLENATRGRFVVEEGELELNSHQQITSSNYAKLPKLDFNIRRKTDADGWQLQIDAHGDTVKVNFTPSVIETGHRVLESVSIAAAALRDDSPSESSSTSVNPLTSQALLQQTQKLKAVVVSINFSGAQITAQYDKGYKSTAYMSKYQVKGDGCLVGSIHVPGVSLRSRFQRKPRHVFHAEVCILESTNVLSPHIKPFLHDILHRVERVMSRHSGNNVGTLGSQSPTMPKPAAILGDLKFSIGLRIQSQELTLTCDPFAKVDANVGVDEIYATLISCKTANHDQTFALTVNMSGAHATLQHHYSGIASAKIKLNDLYLSMFNNDQIRSAEPGISAILKSSALEVTLNARQGISLSRVHLMR